MATFRSSSSLCFVYLAVFLACCCSTDAHSKPYTVPQHGTARPGFSPIYRATYDGNTPVTPLVGSIAGSNATSVWGLLSEATKTFGPQKMLGARRILADDERGEYEWRTYAEVLMKAKEIGSQMKGLILKKRTSGGKNKRTEKDDYEFVAIWANTRMEWMISFYAANAFGLPVTTLYDSLGKNDTLAILHETGATIVCTDRRGVDKLIEYAPEVPALAAVISFDEISEAQKQDAAAVNLSLIYFHAAPPQKVLEPTPGDSESLALVMYSSGTSGQPKGAMHSNKNLLSFVGGYAATGNMFNIGPDDSSLGFLPLAHIYELSMEIAFMHFGARVGYYSEDSKRVAEDMMKLQPTLFSGVPRIFIKMHDQIMARVASMNFILRHAFKFAWDRKLTNYEKTGSLKSGLADWLFFNKVAKKFGGRLRLGICGASSMDPVVLKRLQVALGMPIVEGWGMTEIGGASLQTSDDTEKGVVGGILPRLEFRLQSTMDYVSDPKDSTPPKGELLVRGIGITKGYFMNKQATDEAITEDGWFKTGDVAEVTPNGGLKIIDRIKNIVKTAQGEYVYPEKIEGIYTRAELVSEIYVPGDCTRPHLVAIVVLDEPAVKKWASAHNKSGLSYEDLVASSELKIAVTKEMDRVGGELLTHEKVRNIHLLSSPFSSYHGLWTPTMKLVRSKAKQCFANVIDGLYA